jgi:flotillin
MQVEAVAKRSAEVAVQRAQTEIIDKENSLRQLRADLEAKVRSVEEEAKAAAEEARAQAEAELQEIRGRLEALRLQADTILPSEFARQAAEFKAEGSAALIEERGKAMADVLSIMTEAWVRAGKDAKDIFLIHQIEDIMSTVISQMKSLKINEVSLIDGGDGQALPKHIASYPATVRQILQELHSTTGVDVTGILGQNLLPNLK